MATKQGNMAPTAQPPEPATVTAGTTAPQAITDEQLRAMVQQAVQESGPTLLPPAVESGGVAVEAVTAATWHSNKLVTALWGINETRNAWMHVDGMGWRKLYNGRDGAFVALTMLASQARQTGKPINFRQEADGMVYEIYLW